MSCKVFLSCIWASVINYLCVVNASMPITIDAWLEFEYLPLPLAAQAQSIDAPSLLWP